MRVANSSDAYAGSKMRRDSSASRAILPLYHRTMHFLSDPYTRMKKRALLGAVAALVVLYVVMMGFASHDDDSVVVYNDRPGFQAPPTIPEHAMLPVDGDGDDEEEEEYADDDDHATAEMEDKDDEDDEVDEDDDVAINGNNEPPEPMIAVKPPRPDGKNAGVLGHGTNHVDDADNGHALGDKTPLPPTTMPASKLPYFVRLVLPLLAGFCFGFLGSVPVAGPTSAMVLKLGIQGKYQTALTIAFGGAISEATYAGVAFWGFGSFLAGAKFLLPVSKVLGAVMFTIVGIIFLKSEVKSPLDMDASASHKGMRTRAPRDEFLRNILMGLTMSGINPSLLATYTGAIASVYGTGLLEFTLFLAFVFAIGVCCGVSTWFFILVSLLQKYKQRLKKQTIGYIMRGMGCFLLTLGALCAKSSVEYFFFTSSVET